VAGKGRSERAKSTNVVPPAPSPAKPLSGPQKALRKLGLVRPIDLALHLPLRYEDETRLVKLREVREGEVAQIEAWSPPARSNSRATASCW